MTSLRFTNRRDLQRVDELTARERLQVRICGERWDGNDLPIEERLVLDADIAFQLVLTCWDVVEDDTHVYDAWLFAVDSGVVFRAGTTEIICQVFQFDIQSDDEALAEALADAAARANAI